MSPTSSSVTLSRPIEIRIHNFRSDKRREKLTLTLMLDSHQRFSLRPACMDAVFQQARIRKCFVFSDLLENSIPTYSMGRQN